MATPYGRCRHATHQSVIRETHFARTGPKCGTRRGDDGRGIRVNRRSSDVRAAVILVAVLAAAGLAGCQRDFAAARDLAAAAHSEADLPQKSVMTTDLQGAQVRAWVVDFNGYELIPQERLNEAVVAALEAVGSLDNARHDAGMAILRRLMVPMDDLRPDPWQSGTTADASYYLRSYRGLWRDKARTWWAEHRAAVHLYRRSASAH